MGLSKTKPSVAYTEPSQKELDDFVNALKCDIKPISIGKLEFKGLKFSMVPFSLSSKVNLFGIEEDISVTFNKAKFAFDSILTLGDTNTKLGSAELAFEYYEDKDDFKIEGVIEDTGDFETVLEEAIEDGIPALVSDISDTWNDLKKEKKKINDDLNQIADDLKTEYSNEEDFINHTSSVVDAKKAWNDAVNDINTYKQKCHDLKIWLLGHPCRSFIKGLDDLDKLATKLNDAKNKASDWDISLDWPTFYKPSTLKDSLDTVKKSVAIPKKYTDKISKYTNQQDSNNSALQFIQTSIDTIGHFDSFNSKYLDNIISKIPKIKISEIVFGGDYNDFISNKEPFIMMIKYSINNKEKIDYFTFKPNDMTYTAKALAIFPVMVLEKYLDNLNIENKLENAALTWFKSKVHSRIEGIKKEQLSNNKNIKKYKLILQTYEKNLKSFKKSFHKYNQELDKKTAASSMTDVMGVSKEFKNRYLAIGHSSLCLGVAPNGIDVYQVNCKDSQNERWSTRQLKGGYVQLKNKGLCLKARSITKHSTGNNQPLILSQCDRFDKHEQWKIISRDLYFDQIVNRYSQKCLHFDSESATPKTAYATWTSCIGADSQTFRDIKDAEAASMYEIKALIKSNSPIIKINKRNAHKTISKSCLSTKKDFNSFFKRNEKGHYNISSDNYTTMKNKGKDILMSTKCIKDSSMDRFNYLEEVNGDIKIVHAKTGWCVTPEKGSDKLVMRPCDKNKYTFWEYIKNGEKVQFKNKLLKKCISIKLDRYGKDIIIKRHGHNYDSGIKEYFYKDSPAKIIECKQEESQYISFEK